MNGNFSLSRTSLLLVLATLGACGGGGGGANPSPPPSPGPGPTPTPTPPPGPSTNGIVLPKTGQTTCYDPAGGTGTTSCAGTGQDGELQTGVNAPNPRFTVDNTGDCVTDNLTGLMWIRNGNYLAGDSASTQPAVGQRTWQEALNFANNLDLCGYSDWRLPNRNELRSLIDHEQPNNGVALNGRGFNHVFIGGGAYWSSTSHIAIPTNAWIMNSAGGEVTSFVKTSLAYVWAVRAGQ